MNSTTHRRTIVRPWAGILVLVALLVSACAGGTTGSPNSSPSAATSIPPITSPAPTAASSPAASASAPIADDPANGLEIAAPYTLATPDPTVEASVRQQFIGSAGALGSLLGFGGRGVLSDGKPAGFVFVIAFPPGIMSDVTYQSVLGGLASGSNITFTDTTIAGTTLSTGSSPQGGYGAFRVGDHIVLVVTPPGAAADPIAKALISANP